MRLSKFLSVAGLVTLVALAYVWQQTEIFRLAYIGQKNLSCFQELLDKNAILRYNIEWSGSLVRIGNKVSKMDNFQIPETYRLVKITSPTEGIKIAKGQARQENLFARIFGVRRQAEARPAGQ